ncbi:MAG: beta-N-acetylhexosaminidase [Nitrospinota bacterium]|nr:beta-N-acetylhexosaminidase [Nitrospinota bacterium]
MSDADMLEDKTSEWAAGQLMVIGFDGERYTRETGSLFRQVRPSGAILFSRNIRDATQTRQLIGDIHSLIEDVTGAPAFICLDQEGGRVSRLPEERFPTARHICQKGGEAMVEEHFLMMGERMAQLGFNVDFAPVLDMDTNPENPIIGDRAFGSDKETVITMAAAARRGLDAARILSCAKHFPGHGGADKDSHLELPVDSRARERFLEHELAPFARWAMDEGHLVMTAHVAYPALDKSMLPATLSRPIITGLLREKLGYDGVVVTDDLDMKALADNFGDHDSARMALEAGCDILLCCRDRQRIQNVYDTAQAAVDTGSSMDMMEKKLARIARLKAKLAPRENNGKENTDA